MITRKMKENLLGSIKDVMFFTFELAKGDNCIDQQKLFSNYCKWLLYGCLCCLESVPPQFSGEDNWGILINLKRAVRTITKRHVTIAKINSFSVKCYSQRQKFYSHSVYSVVPSLPSNVEQGMNTAYPLQSQPTEWGSWPRHWTLMCSCFAGQFLVSWKARNQRYSLDFHHQETGFWCEH